MLVPALPAVLRASPLDDVQAAAFVPTEANSWAFPADCPDPAAASPMDLRFLNEAVAGEKGPLVLSPDGNDIHYADGRRFAAWSVHLPHGCDYEVTNDRWTLADYQRSARFLARLGVNLGVFGVIYPGTAEDCMKINPVALDMCHKAHAAAKAEGIYTQMRVCWFHGIKGHALGVPAHEEKDLQALLFFHPRVQEVWKAWTREFLTTVNPYTGLALKDDPALCSVEISNEDSLLFYVTDGIQGDARHVLERRFFDWVVARRGSVEKAVAAWGGAEHPADNPGMQRFGILEMHATTRAGRGMASEARVRDQIEFLVDISRAWNVEAMRFIKEEIGARHVLVASSNFIPADRVTGDDALRLLSWEDMDVMENNHYFEDGGRPLIAGWRLDAGSIQGVRSAVRDPLGLATNKRQREGRPMWCTEILWPRAHPREVEGPLMIAAYQCLNGLDALVWAGPRDITWERWDRVYLPADGRFMADGSPAMFPFACSGPSTLGQFPAAAAILRLGLLREAAPVVREVRTREQILARELPATTELYSFDPGRYDTRAKADAVAASGIPQEVFLVGPVRVRLGESPEPPVVADLAPYVLKGRTVSATGEIVSEPGRGLLLVDAPAVQAAVGFLAEAGPIQLGQAALRCSAQHGALAVVALDAKPLAQSTRILMQLGTRTAPTGWRETPILWRERGAERHGLRVDSTGTLPWRVQNATATVRLARSVARTALALDGNGNPMPGVPVRMTRDGEAVEVEFPPGTMYVVLQ
jgi:hypothetical protein